jgi:NAD(P)-dependent dehydrogenase (short-subunit alcohol dehydrogenase family)
MPDIIIVTGASGFLGKQLVDRLCTEIRCPVWALDKLVSEFSSNVNFCQVDLSDKTSISSFVNSLNNINGARILLYHAASLNPTANSLLSLVEKTDILEDAIDLVPKAVTIEIVGLLTLLQFLIGKGIGSLDIVWLNSIYGVMSPDPRLYHDAGLRVKPLHYPVVKHAAMATADYIALLDFDVPVTVKSVVLGGISSGRESQEFKESYQKYMGHKLIEPEVVLSKLVDFSSYATINNDVDYIIGHDA